VKKCTVYVIDRICEQVENWERTVLTVRSRLLMMCWATLMMVTHAATHMLYTG